MAFVRIGALLGFLGVAFGAFGAHALKNRLSPESMHIWHTASFYHLVHAVVLLALGFYSKTSGNTTRFLGSFFLAGIVLFSGSLYTLALTGIKAFGAITPLGGICLMIGWGCLALKKA
ncbi:MAG TPA: DUF423 domain-containing protein [Fibrobacteres bacterium]|jgi:uncharacterized membrane protein YgdD (TMEM256/DUF423 family)|nr:DUF423 domain-containing protein [Fibrobacterota bacterium]